MIKIRKRHFTQIPLLEIYPAAAENKILPTIIYYHGWRSNKELVLTNAKKLAEAGFRVLAPDSLNHGERYSEVSPIISFTFWQTIQANIVEFNQIIAHGQRLNLLDPEKIGVAGVSMGGMTASAIFAANPEVQAAACLMGTPALAAYRDFIINYAADNHRKLPGQYLKTLGFIEEFDVLKHQDQIANRPFLIWHDQQDPKIPFAQVEEFVEQTKDAPTNQQMEVIFTNHYGHLLTAEIMEKMVQFFISHLK